MKYKRMERGREVKRTITLGLTKLCYKMTQTQKLKETSVLILSVHISASVPLKKLSENG